jgi:uncharacterized glyoxalase superfamily protein PhnB
MTKALELGELANYATVNVAGNTVTLDTVLTNDSATVGGNTASTLRTYSDDKAANAYANVFNGGTFTGVVTMQANLTANTVRLNGSMQIDGDLIVSGNTVTMNVSSLAVEDNMIYLNSSSNVANPDIGIAGNYNDGTYRHTGVFRDATDGVWKFFHQYVPEPDASAYIDTANNTFALANVQANTFIGAHSGSLSGNVVGNTANLTTSVTVGANALTVGNTLYVVANGNIGVGAVGPDYKIDVVADTPSDPFVSAAFRNSATGSSNAYGGLMVGGLYQSHIRFLTGNTNWSGTGAKKWQIRTGAGNSGDDRLNIYSWSYGDEVISFSNTGFVGVGNSAPVTKLHLTYANGDYTANGTSGFINEATSGRATMRLRSATDNPIDFFFDVNQSARWDLSARGSAQNYRLDLYGQPTTNTYHSVSGPYITVLQTGNVGIGNSAPTEKLHITGGKFRMDTSGYPMINLNNTDSGNYFLMQFAENGNQKTYFGLGGTSQSFGTYAAYATDGLSLNHDGAGKVTISNRGSSKSIWLCTGTESLSDFPTIILKNKMMQLPTQPRFYAYGVSGTTYNHGSYWIFPTTRVNVGSHYNTSTGVFTVPTDGGGTYFFSWGNIGGNSDTVYRYYIHINSAAVGDEHLRLDCTASGSDFAPNASRNIMFSLSAGDTARIYYVSDSTASSYPGAADATNNYCYFSGYLMG